jgi:ATP-binding cassette subfamily F protein uup
MPQISLRNISIGTGQHALLEKANLQIEAGDKVCLIGRNGAGKSTLLKLLLGEITPDNGVIEMEGTLKMALLQQTVPKGIAKSVFDIVAEPLRQLDLEPWQMDHKVEKVLSLLKLDGNRSFDQLSGGLKRRVLLAKALVEEPDILLLDEPTNHLDIESITWLEKFLQNYQKTLIFVTHDRVIMQNISTHIVEIDNAQLYSWRGSYPDFLRNKETLLQAEARANALFDKRLANEEVWIRQGIKARRTRNEGRVRHLEKMREERRTRRERIGNVNLSQHDLPKSGKIVFEAKDISYRYHDIDIIKNFSTVIMRGDKIGIIGANGTGKTTLINLLLGRLNPTSGKVHEGTNVTIGYFDQQQMALDEDKTVFDNVAGGSDIVTIGDQKKHIISYLQDFLFTPERARSRVKILSGGERNRVMLAKLFLNPCNVLVLDEPTNDLDVETLELLEEQLNEFSGTLLLVSHDRAFLNNIVTSTLVMEGNGHVGEYVGGYDDWLRQRKVIETTAATTSAKPALSSAEATPARKRSYKEQRELETLATRIETLESEQRALHEKLGNPEFYKNHSAEIPALQKQLHQLESDIEAAYARWQELE